jgi:hypothetical protein
VIDQTHQELGHLGTAKTYLKLAPTCVWPNMYRDVKQYIHTCHECQVNKWPTARPAGRAHVLPILERPWQSIAIDFAGPLTMSQCDYGIDSQCYPMKEKFSAVDIADIFIATFYGRHGLPESIVSDRDSRFTRKFWTALQKTLGIELLMATAFHQETNGQLECTNKTIMQTLRIFSNGQGRIGQRIWGVLSTRIISRQARGQTVRHLRWYMGGHLQRFHSSSQRAITRLWKPTSIS